MFTNHSPTGPQVNMQEQTMAETSEFRSALDAGEGILRLVPCWVPRIIEVPGGRLRLDARDTYALGVHRGGLNERWFASTTRANNGPATPHDEGLSYAAVGSGRVQLRELIAEHGDELLGADVMRTQGGWNVLAKFFDNRRPIPHHMHPRDEHARLVGQKGKYEGYFFPPQYNHITHSFPCTFMGLEPGTTKDDVRRCLERWNEGDNGILYHSRAYKTEIGTSWQIDAGILHAPGTLLTYEVQVNTDVMAAFQSMVEGHAIPWNAVIRDVPAEHKQDLDFIIGLLDWDANVDPEFARHRRFFPSPVRDEAEMAEAGYSEKRIAHSPGRYSATELTILPGRSTVLRDPAAYGVIVVQGYGAVGPLEVETPSVIRYGEQTKDELFVSAPAARNGVRIANRSDREPLVLLKHFGPEGS